MNILDPWNLVFAAGTGEEWKRPMDADEPQGGQSRLSLPRAVVRQAQRQEGEQHRAWCCRENTRPPLGSV
jgi:hypothetical protein